ncbi:hypothetical protein [Phytoactinopolyspora mesophila]|nr:hypothetical protein [Phytoactinopolyspora mesophila]
MNDDDRSGDYAFDVVRTDRHELDLRTPPTREAVGISEDSTGVSVAADDEASRVIHAHVLLPDGVELDLEPYRLVVEPRAGSARPQGLTTRTAPPARANLMFTFETVDEASAFLSELAAQLGEHRGTLTDDYIERTSQILATGERPHPLIASAEIGYLTLSVRPRAGSSAGGRSTAHITFNWSAMPDD